VSPGSLPLTLVTGPANAEKAGAAMDAYRTALAAGREPVLVVPTFADVEVYRRELAAAGAVFGVQVVRFNWLLRQIADRRQFLLDKGFDELRERSAAVAAADAVMKVKDLAINGGDVMQILGVPPSRIVGEVLEKLLERVIDDPSLNTRETLAALVPEVAKELAKH